MSARRLALTALVLLLMAGLLGAVMPSLRAAWIAVAALLFLIIGTARAGGAAGELRARRSYFDENVAVAGSSAGRRPKDLADIERRFSWGAYSPDEFEVRIRPLLERLIETRAGGAGGTHVAPADIPNDLKELLDGAGRPRRTEGETTTTADIAAIVDRIERL